MNMLDVSNDLSDLFSAYDNLQVLASADNADSGNVASVLLVLNRQFEKVYSDFEELRKPGGVLGWQVSTNSQQHSSL